MSTRTRSVASTGRAIEALVEVGEHGGTLRPPHADSYVWADEVLHELATIAQLLGTAAREVIGERSPAIERHAHALATALDAQGNLQLLHRHP